MTFKIREIIDLVPEEGLNDNNKPKSIEQIVAESEQKIIETEKIRQIIALELSTYGSYKHGSIPFPEETIKPKTRESPLGRETSPNIIEETANNETAQIDLDSDELKRYDASLSSKTPSRSLKKTTTKFYMKFFKSTHPEDI